MLQPVSVGLKFGFLIVLYLFLVWVAMSTLFDMRRGPGGGRRAGGVVTSDETSIHQSVDPLAALEQDFEPRLVVEHADGHESGVAYDLMDPVTLGRGDVEIRLGDPFASTRHAKITRQGRTLVVEDLGSTNGTYLNDELLGGPQPLHDGDRIRIGDSEFTYFQ
ncbi:MAG: FHA domain-containing protein [Conexibacteraceae bacterium]|nr:FHA domain-containing protein [Conexibacteraceae bacterium]